MRLRRLALALLLLAACGDPVRPADAAGTFVLRSVAGDALPAVVYTTPGFTARVLADTVRLAGDGTGSVVRVAVADGPAADAGVPYTYARPARYAVTGDRIAGEYVCGPAELCVPPPHFVGRLEAGRLVVEETLGQRVPQLYARVGTR